eukprot:2276136-Rhodomonas_salina.1
MAFSPLLRSLRHHTATIQKAAWHEQLPHLCDEPRTRDGDAVCVGWNVDEKAGVRSARCSERCSLLPIAIVLRQFPSSGNSDVAVLSRNLYRVVAKTVMKL